MSLFVSDQILSLQPIEIFRKIQKRLSHSICEIWMQHDELREPFVKKLIQLHKVTEYVSFHLEEHVFQMETLRRRYESAEDAILDGAEKEMALFNDNSKLNDKELIDAAQKDFDRTVNAMKAEIAQAKQSAVEQITRAHKRLKHAIHTSKKEIAQIESNLANQVAFLSNDANFRPDNISEKEAQANAEFQEAIRIHDEESVRKEKLFEEQSKQREEEITKDYRRGLNKRTWIFAQEQKRWREKLSTA